jgi:uncharacterized membrane protein (UPF0127 family)
MKNPGSQKVYFSKKLTLYTLIALILVIILSFNIYAKNLPEEAYVVVNDKKVNLEIADTEEKREIGLMFRDKIQENQGMIFLFDKPDYVNFWMKNVKIPLDILFISKDKIVTIYNMVPICIQEPCEIYPSKYKIDYVIELQGGFCYKNKVKVGQTVKLSKSLQKN